MIQGQQRMASLILRNYQEEGLEKIQKEFESGTSRQLIVLPTGSGKTILMAAIAKHYDKKVLILAHRGELLEQAKTKIKLYWPEADIGICKAQRNEIDHQIVIGSVQSCCRSKRLKQLREKDFDILMIDEAHHAAASTYQKIINALGFQSKDIQKNKLLIGFTATPKRSDKKELGNTFDKITFSKSIEELIKEGYLSPVIGRKILTSFVLKGIKTHMGDFAIGKLAEAVNTPERNKFVVSKYKTYAQDRKSIAFCVDVQHCKDLAKEFSKQGIKASAIWGAMPEKNRKRILKRLKNGRLSVVTSCNLLTEGFDLPSLDAIVMSRPTKSKALYIQMVGRGLRTNPGKENCIIFDFTDKHHNINNIISLEITIPKACIKKDDTSVDVPRVDLKSLDRTPTITVEKEVDKEFNVFGDIKFIWIDIGDGEYSLTDDLNNEIVVHQIIKKFIATIFFKDGETKTLVSEPLPLNYCIGTCEEYARRHFKLTYADMNGEWVRKNQNSKPTDNQKNFLRNNHAYNPRMNKVEASLAIRKIIALSRKYNRNNEATPAQKFFLERAGVNRNNITKKQAMDLIIQLKNKMGVFNEKRYTNF